MGAKRDGERYRERGTQRDRKSNTETRERQSAEKVKYGIR